MGSTAYWYKDGNFYDVGSAETHVNFFLQNPELLGFTQREKEELCVENGISPDAIECDELSQHRVDIMLEVLKRGAIRIRFYGGKTSVQCYDHDNKMNYRELQNCILDGLNEYFGKIITVMDTKGWGLDLNSYGWGMQIKDFIAAALKRREKDAIMSRSRNERNLNEIFSNKELIYDCIIKNKYVSIRKLIESNVRLYDLLKGKHAERGYIIISACRDSSNPSVSTKLSNKRRTEELKADIQRSMYSYMPVFGGYIEDDNGEVLETSFVVFNYDRLGIEGVFDDLKQFALSMCEKYNQDSVLIYEPGSIPKYYDSKGHVVSDPHNTTNKAKINDMSEPFFTEFKNKSKRFTYDINFPDDEVNSSFIRILCSYDYFARPPETYGERYRRYKLGERFI